MDKRDITLFASEDRAESTSVTHALLLSATFVLLASVTAGGVGPVADAQDQLSMSVMDDRFESWENEADTILIAGEPKRSRLITPPGIVSIEPGATTIEITNDDTGATKTIQTATFRFQATDGIDGSRITYDSGLITEQLSATTPPTLVRPPHQTAYTGGTDRLILTVYEYNLSSPIRSDSAFPSQIRFNHYPNATENIVEEYPVGTDADITVTGENYDSWEAFFESSSQYQVTTTSGNSVTATVEAEYFKVKSRYTLFNKTVGASDLV